MSTISTLRCSDKRTMQELARARRTLEFAWLDGINTPAIRRLEELVRSYDMPESASGPGIAVPPPVLVAQPTSSHVSV